jgi:hypothetical protein
MFDYGQKLTYTTVHVHDLTLHLVVDCVDDYVADRVDDRNDDRVVDCLVL